MGAGAEPGPVLELESGLDEHRTVWATALRAVATQWRFKANAGRLSDHSLAGVLRLVSSFEEAANALEDLSEPISSEEDDAPETEHVEEALRESEERFRLLIDSVSDYAIFMLDPNGIVSTWNKGAQRIKGYSAEEIIGRPFSTFYPPEALQSGLPARELVIATREGRYHEEGWRVRKDGTLFWADVTITALRDDTGRLRGFAKITRDLTERVKQEHALREANAFLEERVKERTAELASLNAEMESFSYSISHDLRGPLRAIEGFSKVLADDYSRVLDAQGQHYLERVRSGSQRMANLIDDLLNLSRITRVETVKVSLDLAELAREVLEELRRRTPGRAVTVTVVPSAPTVGDSRLLRVALENLLGNAWKFTAGKADARIEFGVQQSEGAQHFFVKDNGAGFDMAYADKLFAPFQRLHDEEEFEGTGIGLATVHRVIRRHQGRIWAEAEPERGATFWFTLGGA